MISSSRSVIFKVSESQVNSSAELAVEIELLKVLLISLKIPETLFASKDSFGEFHRFYHNAQSDILFIYARIFFARAWSKAKNKYVKNIRFKFFTSLLWFVLFTTFLAAYKPLKSIQPVIKRMSMMSVNEFVVPE